MSNNVAIAKVKKNDTVIMCAFTGMKIGVKEVVAADKNTITVATNDKEVVFDRKTGKQIEPEPKAERFANYLIPDDGSYVAPQRKKKAKPAKASTKKAKDEDEVEDDEEEDETPAPKKTKKSAPAKKSKKQPEPEPEDEEDDDEWDDDDDEDFEEVE